MTPPAASTRARRDVYRIIRALSADGVGVVVVSSEVGEISEVSDRILVVNRGPLVELPEGVRSVDQVSAATFGTKDETTAGCGS